MDILRWFESIRTPFLDKFFSIVTILGEETIFILVGILFFWCVDKKKGYFLLSVGFLGTLINQFLKLLFRIPRPWVQDPDFTIVESARAEATGYSFPSGHTQSSVGVFGGMARVFKPWAIRVLCLIPCVLVPISRMYLGVHTPADVVVSIVVATVLIFTLYPIMQFVMAKPSRMRVFFAAMTAAALAYLGFVLFFSFPADTDVHNLESGIQNAYKILGCIVGLWVAFEIDNKWISFDTKAVWWAQILKIALGALPLLAVKSLLKTPLYTLFDGNFIADGVRYFLVALIAGAVWPLTFRFFGKLGKKKEAALPPVSED